MIDEMPRLLLVDDVKKTPNAKESHLVAIPNTNIAETFPTFYWANQLVFISNTPSKMTLLGAFLQPEFN